MISRIDDYIIDNMMQPFCDYVYKEWGPSCSDLRKWFSIAGIIASILTQDFIFLIITFVLLVVSHKRSQMSGENDIAMAMYNRLFWHQVTRTMILLLIIPTMAVTGIGPLSVLVVYYLLACYTPPGIPRKEWNFYSPMSTA